MIITKTTSTIKFKSTFFGPQIKEIPINIYNQLLKLIKSDFKLRLLVSFLLFFLILGCKESNNQSNCGCSGEIEFTIEDKDEQIGYLFRNTDQKNNNIPQFNYGIWFNEANCSNCVHHFFVCNDNSLLKINDIPSYPGVRVKFSGKAKALCKQPAAPADYTYNYIELTKIELFEK